MRFSRCARLASLLLGAGLLVGCGGSGGGPMKNYPPATGPEVQMDLPLKKGNKPMPADPPEPTAPPLPGR